MSLNSESDTIIEITNRLFDGLLWTLPSSTGTEAFEARRAILHLKSDVISSIDDGTFPDDLLNSFTTARESGANLTRFGSVRKQLLEEETEEGAIARSIVHLSLIYCISSESRIVKDTIYKSRDDVEVVLAKMKLAFDDVKEVAADEMDSGAYTSILTLASSLMTYLGDTARKLPRIINFTMPVNYPALTLSNVIYHTAERWEELVDENKIVHPAFFVRDIKALAVQE